ncbi:MAG: UvrD-helicase domain-containing protein [Nitrospirae bacterium]|nr:UvrD-helicase domain-containing protein [Nitrospirota bacterium]
MDLLSALNPLQRQAVEYTEGPLLILAGAGSGKTRVITHRIACLVYHLGVSPGHILAVTFTNKASEEMKARIFKLWDAECGMRNMEGLWTGTFHSICLRFLRMHSQVIGYRKDFSVYDKADQLGLVKECTKELNISDDRYPASAIARQISFLKGRLTTPAEFSQRAQGFGMEDKVLKVYRMYQDKLARNHAMDFDDLIMRCIELFEKDSEVLGRYQERFKYVLVDEYQDTNPSQYKLIRLLSDRHRNLCVVGDDDQSIYRFRGAELQNILGFESDYPDAMVIRLEQNYRSTGSILNAAGRLIEKNIGRKQKKLWTENPAGEPVVYHRVSDERGEAAYVLNCIRSMMRNGRDPGHFAVLYRTNAQSRAIEEALREAAIPYKIIGGIRFYERKEVKDIQAYIRISLMQDDDVSLRRIINVPHRGIGAATLKTLEEFSKARGCSLYQGVVNMSPATPRLEGFVSLIEKLRILVRELPPSEFVKRIFEVTGYVEALKRDEEGEDRIENVMELMGAAKRYEERMPEMGIEGFMDEVSLLSDEDISHINSQVPARKTHAATMVSLMTLHSAKGLEFPVVFITGLEEGILPHVRAFESEEDVEEERRLCYVGITRARERLYLTSAVSRNLFGQSQSRRESRFFREIKEDSKIRVEIGEPDMYNVMYNNIRSQTHGSDVRPLKKGDRVRHLQWGVGVIQSSEGRGDQEKVVVRFYSIGPKTLAVRFANLEVL